MTVVQVRRALEALPDDLEVMIERGEWGPSRIKNVNTALVVDQGDVHNWEVPFPESEPYENEKRISVALIG